MMYQGIDLSRFKKIAGDGKTSTLRHAKGHEIKIAHASLSPAIRDHLGQMPVHLAGGDPDGEEPVAPESPETADDTPDDAPPPPAQPEAPEAPEAPEEPAEDAPAIPPKPSVMPQAGTIDVPAQRQPSMPMYPIDPNYLKQQDAGWAQDLTSGHIKPETMSDLWDKKSTTGKIGTLFGLLLSGAGSGLAHQPNAVMEMMKNEIDRDFEGQKLSKQNAYNFLRLNTEHQMQLANIEQLKKSGHLTDAQASLAEKEAGLKGYTLARMQANRAAFHDLVLMTNKLPLGSPQREQAEQKLAIMFQGINAENFDLADRAAAASALAHAAFGQTQGAGGEAGFQGRSGVLRLSGNAPLADDMTAKHFPGIEGQASVPLSGQDRENIQAGISFQNQLQRFIDWSKKHSGDLNPSDRKYGEAEAAQLQGAYRLATKGGVYKEGEQGFISNIIDSTPTKFLNSIRVLPSLKAVQKESSDQLDDLLKSKGFKGYKGPEQYKVIGGVKYKRGPNGEAIKVD